MLYLVLKYAHTIAAAATISGFVLRGYWMLNESPMLQHRATKIVPHIIDTLFLLAGIGMLWMLHLNPLKQGWLLAKFAGLIAYIFLGTIAIKRGPTQQIRAIAFVAAISVFAYIAGAALTKSALSWLRYLAVS
jgi:uncharacterized membrane protein SirB2